MKILPAAQAQWDIAALGEVMLRMDPGETRVRSAQSFTVWEGGGEYNVARALNRCFGKRATLITGFVDNELGYLLENRILQGGVDYSHSKWFPYDGIGREVRIGLNFTERGFGIRAAKGVSDRARSAASCLQIDDIDWEQLFAAEKVRWFHTGGIFTGLSSTTPQVALRAIETARNNQCMVSYDLNYRPSLWKAFGGKQHCQEVNRRIAPQVDVILGNEEDFTAALGFPVSNTHEDLRDIQVSRFKHMIEQVVKTFPNLQAVGTTLRTAKTASINDWGAVLYYQGTFYEATKRNNLEILDRVGGGDSFASGLIYAFLEGKTPQEAVEYGAAHGALAMTTPGDTSMARLAEVEKLVQQGSGGTARIDR